MTLKERFAEKFGGESFVRSWGMEECKCGKEPCVCSDDIKAFFHQELLALAEEVEKKMANSADVAHGELYNMGVCEAANLIKAKAAELR